MNKLIGVILFVLVVGIGAYILGKKEGSENVVVNTVNQQQAQIQPSSDNEKVATTEESSTETFKNQPGEVKSVTVKGTNEWQLSVDLLSPNPKWLPGVDSSGDFFINQSPKLRTLVVNAKTETFQCNMRADDNVVKANMQVGTATYIKKIQSDTYKTRYFDINGSIITAIYEQCLP